MNTRFFATLFSSFGLLVLLALLAWLLPHGFDITDDSFYLLNARFPESINQAVSHFFFYTHYLYAWGDFDIARFRYSGALLLGLVAVFYARSWVQAQAALDARHAASSDSGWVSFLLLVIACLYFYFWRWYPSPSYNWLNLIACLLFCCGALRYAQAQTRGVMLAAGVLIGLAGFLAFMAKPPAAAVLAIIALGWFVFVNRERRSWLFALAAAGSCALLFGVHVFVIFDGPASYLNYLGAGLGHTNEIGDNHSASRIIDRLTTFWLDSLGIGLGVLLLLGLGFAIDWRSRGLASHDGFAGRTRWLLGTLLIIGAAAFYGEIHEDKEKLARIVAIVNFTLIGLCIIKSMLWLDAAYSAQLRDTAKYFVLNIALAMAFVCGTDISPAMMTTAAMAFLAANLLLATRLLCVAAPGVNADNWATLFLLPVLLWGVIEELRYPYRLAAPLYAQNEALAIDGGTIYVDAATREYVTLLRQYTLEQGFDSRYELLVDITGHSPGASLLIGSRPPGRAWLLGGKEGSDDVAQLALADALADGFPPWVLEAPGGKRALGEAVLTNNGVAFPRRYKLVGELVHPCRNKGNDLEGCEVERQRLWQPLP